MNTIELRKYAESKVSMDYGPLDKAAREIANLITTDYKLSNSSIAYLLLQEDQEIISLAKQKEKNFPKIMDIIEKTQNVYPEPLQYVIAMKRQSNVRDILKDVVGTQNKERSSFARWLDKATIQPLTGIPILLLVLYFGLYQFVGVFGAGTVVDFIEVNIFETYINPWVNNLVVSTIPYRPLQELLALDYGIITLGLRYAAAIILPIVGAFFLIFSIIEDSGYLPRLALLVDRVFKKIGLNGRAVIPMTLGFGCGTMATLVTRTLETRREKVIATMLLALAIPCSAQLGVIMALLSNNPGGMLIWVLFVLGIFLFIGFLTAKILPGEGPAFYMVVPPLRLPKLSNVLEKTFSRMKWYFIEIVPLFILGSVLIWVGRITGLFELMINLLAPIITTLGLPKEAAEIFLFGFFRRDYGAAGLYDLQKSGILSGVQIVVSAVTLTLFVPCVAQFLVMIKERGAKTALAIVAFVIPFAFLAGYILNLLLNSLGVVL